MPRLLKRNRNYVPIEDVARLFQKANLPLRILWGLAAVQQQRAGRDHDRPTPKRGGLRLRTIPKPGSSHRLLYHIGDVRAAIAKIVEATDLGRSTSKPFRHRGVIWLPSKTVKKRGFDLPTMIAWTLRCPWLPKPLESNLWLAKTDTGRFRWTLYYREDQIEEIEKRMKSGEGPIKRPRPRKERPKPKYETPDLKLWGDTDEAILGTGATGHGHLYYWSKNGFPLPSGGKLPLKRKKFKVASARGTPKMFWWRAHWPAIKAVRDQQRPAEQLVDGQFLRPFIDEQGMKWQRERHVVRELGCSVNGLAKMAERCPALDGEPFKRRKVPSIRSTKPEEWAYRDDLFQRVKAALSMTKAEADKRDFFLDPERGRYLPQHHALRIVKNTILIREAGADPDKLIHVQLATLPYRPNRTGKSGQRQKVFREQDLLNHPDAKVKESLFRSLNGNGGHEAGRRVAVPKKARRKRGRPVVDEAAARRYTAIMEGRQRSLDAGIKLSEFLKDYNAGEGLESGEFERARGWWYSQRKHQH